MGAPIVDRNLARDDPTTPSRASRTSKRAASTWTNRRVHRPADAPSTGSRRLRRATAPSFHSEPPTLHPRLTRPRPSPATVPQASEAAGEPTTRIGRVKLNLRHIMHRHATGTKRARACLFLVPVIMILVMVTRPIYAPLMRRLRARRAGGGFEARRRRRRRLERADDDNWRRRPTRGARATRREREAGAPRRSPGGRTPNITRRGIVREMVREKVGERRRERFGDGSANGSAKRDGERNRSPRRTARLTRASPIR